MGQQGYKCKLCGEIATSCDSEDCAERFYNKTHSVEGKQLKSKFYCWTDTSGEFCNHFCSKKCLPKVKVKKTTGEWGYW